MPHVVAPLQFTQLLPRSYRSALSQLHSGHCSRLQSYHNSVGWADESMTPPVPSNCQSTDHTAYGGLPLQLSYSSHRSGPGGYEEDTHPGCPIPGRAPTVLRPAPTHPLQNRRSILIPFLHNLNSRCWPPPPWPPAGPHHPHLALHPTSSHL